MSARGKMPHRHRLYLSDSDKIISIDAIYYRLIRNIRGNSNPSRPLYYFALNQSAREPCITCHPLLCHSNAENIIFRQRGHDEAFAHLFSGLPAILKSWSWSTVTKRHFFWLKKWCTLRPAKFNSQTFYEYPELMRRNLKLLAEHASNHTAKRSILKKVWAISDGNGGRN